MRGKVRYVNVDRGFGFAENSENRNIFFHIKECPREIPWDKSLIGREISFDLVNEEKGVRAVHVNFPDDGFGDGVTQ